MWFKRCYVEPILSGEKTDTIRVPSRRIPAVGSIVPASVGPIRPFAWLRIVAVEDIAAERLTPERRREVESLVGRRDVYQRIVFAVER